jgi:uncharacterized membrane protein (UPF0127 family)
MKNIDIFISNKIFTKYGKTQVNQLRRGDLVIDRGYINCPRVPSDSVGRIRNVKANYAIVDWRDGTEDQVTLSSLIKVRAKYESNLNDQAYNQIRLAVGTKVALGNGDVGHIVDDITGPTGFKSYRVKISDSNNPTNINRQVYATQNGLCKISSIVDNDVMVSIRHDNNILAFSCEVASNEESQVIGLQKYSSLAPDRGMLFTYKTPRSVVFHMGDVQFPIDIIGIDQHQRISKIQSYCQPDIENYWRFYKVSAILEINSGLADRYNLQIGDQIQISKIAFCQPRQAQETMQPGRPDLNQRPLSDIRPDAPDRYKNVETPDKLLGDSINYVDPKNWDQQQGHDPSIESDTIAPIRPN